MPWSSDRTPLNPFVVLYYKLAGSNSHAYTPLSITNCSDFKIFFTERVCLYISRYIHTLSHIYNIIIFNKTLDFQYEYLYVSKQVKNDAGVKQNMHDCVVFT